MPALPVVLGLVPALVQVVQEQGPGSLLRLQLRS